MARVRYPLEGSRLEAIAAAATASAAALAATTAEATSAAAATAEAATATAAERAATAARALLRLIHTDGAAVELGAVQLCDGLGRAFGRRHRDEGESTRTARFAIRGERHFLDLSYGGEDLLDRGLSGSKREISNEQTISHG